MSGVASHSEIATEGQSCVTRPVLTILQTKQNAELTVTRCARNKHGAHSGRALVDLRRDGPLCSSFLNRSGRRADVETLTAGAS